MGRYRQQYLYRCPHVACRNQVVEPGAMPAAAAIDWSILGTKIGDRTVPLKPKTLARIEAGLRRYARPITLEAAGNTFERRPGVRTWPADGPLTTQTATASKGVACPPMMVPAGGTWREDPAPVTGPMGARTTRENDGLAVPPFITVHRGGEGDVRTGSITDAVPTVAAGGNHLGVAVPPFLVPLRSGRNRSMLAGREPLATVVADGANHGLVTPPLLVPVEGREGKEALPADVPARTQTARAETGLAVPACALIMRNNGSRGDGGEHCTPAVEPLRTLTAAGHQSLLTWEHLAHLLVPYYRTGVARPAAEPVGSVTTRDRVGLASPAVDVNDVLFRMLEPHEIGAAMAFVHGYEVVGSKRERVRQYGNAVTPPVAEVLISALTEAITGERLPDADTIQPGLRGAGA
jgi:DNA (cytosine-5)-methyltransferase 1